MPREKYKIHELAKDFGMNSKAIIEILAKLDDEPRKHTTVLDDKQLDYIFETVTQNNQVDSFDAYFAATAVKAEAKKEEKAPEVKEEAKKEEAPAKKEAPKAQAPAKAEAKPQQKAPEKKPQAQNNQKPQQNQQRPQQNNQPKKEKNDGPLQARTKGEKRTVATISAVSKSMVWLTVAIVPSLNISLITSAAVLLRRAASSPTVISSGILTTRVLFALSASILLSLSASVSLLPFFPPFLLYC